MAGAGPHIRARSGAPNQGAAPSNHWGPARGREGGPPTGAKVAGFLQTGRRQSGWDSSLGRWTGAEGSGTKTPILYSTTRVNHMT